MSKDKSKKWVISAPLFYNYAGILEFLEFNYKNFIRNSRILILKNSKNLEFLEVFI
ncbi:hypothetical protein [Campylobacter sp.]|uniref:hypothetical protein n=1 Tax=Campylobacter sp. TaxID=205 RepID=UPI002AA83506|nr:hypothetical protein [Campylobacter sp.]MCI6564288.1 hypothetical protein [Campylobacter sp.]